MILREKWLAGRLYRERRGVRTRMMRCRERPMTTKGELTFPAPIKILAEKAAQKHNSNDSSEGG
jgi:hypothetical protein